MMGDLILIFEWTVSASIKTVPIILFVCLLQRFAKNWISASGFHFLWLLVLVSLCFPWGWQFNSPTYPVHEKLNSVMPDQRDNERGSIAANYSVKAPASLRLNDLTAINHSANSSEKAIFFTSVWRKQLMPLAVFWFVGVAVFAALISRQLFRYKKLTRQAEVADVEWQAQLSLYSQQLAIKQQIYLMVSREIDSPITFGLWKPVILLPAAFAKQFNKEQREHVLLHELSHVKRKDILFCWVASVATLLHWYNPAAWLAFSCIRKNMELACDAEVLKHLPLTHISRYGKTLINLSTKNYEINHRMLAVGILGKHTLLKERITMLKQPRMNNKFSKSIFGIIAIVLALGAFAKPDISDDLAVAEGSDNKNPDTISLVALAKRAEIKLNMPVLVSASHAEAEIRIPKNVDELSYGSLLSILRSNNFTAYKSSDLLNIIPLKNARSSAIPVVEENQSYHEDEYVTAFLKLEKACATKLLPMLRPMVPKHGHMAAQTKYRGILITDSFGNVKRIKRVISEFENNLKARDKDCGKLPKKKVAMIRESVPVKEVFPLKEVVPFEDVVPFEKELSPVEENKTNG